MVGATRYYPDVRPATSPGPDLERVVPDLASDDPLDQAILATHVARYEFAARYVAGRSVLDLACGVGYGSALLAHAGAMAVLGVDVPAEAIAYARRRYADPGVTFEEADGMRFRPPRPPEVIVSLETIEHVPDPRGFVTRLVGMLPPCGLFVGSVPTTLSTDVNPYHLHDFTSRGFRTLLVEAGLAIVGELEQEQRMSPLALRRLVRNSPRDYRLRPNLLTYYARNPRMFARRLRATLRDGFATRYLVLAGRKA
jgi:SAM-dependent methyltransferase